jgi:PIN domain nuclease of toxin-antitoxin system
MILLDTHVAVWLLAVPDLLSWKARDAILQARRLGEAIGYSPVSLYEMAWAARRKRLPLNIPAKEFIAEVQRNLELVPLTAEIAVLASEISTPFHGDPMDRIIVATAIANDCTLITHDDRIHKANVCKVLW